MMFRLVSDILSHLFQSALRHGKSAKSFLPLEFARIPSFFIDEPGGIGLEFLGKLRNRQGGMQAHQKMEMVVHSAYALQKAVQCFDEAGGIGIYFLLNFRGQKTHPMFGGDHIMNLNLGVGVGHRYLLPANMITRSLERNKRLRQTPP
ncbi:MAG: hypothetical protein PHD87_06695 [Candidatus Cloacimonetes bacterium]|nr:hypothetical protein [Candidatus Cloacimonadota bacterium]